MCKFDMLNQISLPWQSIACLNTVKPHQLNKNNVALCCGGIEIYPETDEYKCSCRLLCLNICVPADRKC